jgi:uncharacterized protein YodC (DUF2158 family)
MSVAGSAAVVAFKGVASMTDEIKPGDMVQLWSGGPNMSVARIENEAGVVSARCSWHDGKKIRTDTFPTALLTQTN